MTPLTEAEKAQRPLDLMEAAEFLRISRTTMLRLLKRGDIQAVKVGGQWRILRSALDDYLSGAKPQGEQEQK